MRHVLGGLGQSAKIVYDEGRGQIRIWQKGWIGKRKYRIKVSQVSTVMYGWYTSRIRLPMRGFNLEFQHKGKNVVVTIPGEHKKFVPLAESLVQSIGRSAGLSEFKVDGANVYFSRSNPGGKIISNSAMRASDGSPLTKTEQAIAVAARGTKNVSKEIFSDAGNAVSGVGKFVLYGIGTIVFFLLLGSNPVAAFLLLVVSIAVIRKNR
jgi:hypothetical protein